MPLGLSYFSEIPLMIFHSIRFLKALYRHRSESGIEARRQLLNRISRKLSPKVEYEMRFRRLCHHYLNYNFPPSEITSIHRALSIVNDLPKPTPRPIIALRSALCRSASLMYSLERVTIGQSLQGPY